MVPGSLDLNQNQPLQFSNPANSFGNRPAPSGRKGTVSRNENDLAESGQSFPDLLRRADNQVFWLFYFPRITDSTRAASTGRSQQSHVPLKSLLAFRNNRPDQIKKDPKEPSRAGIRLAYVLNKSLSSASKQIRMHASGPIDRRLAQTQSLVAISIVSC
jgi:hypothetical protein